LDKLTVLSNSDAHSLPNIAREANVFAMKSLSYDEIYDIIKNKKISRSDNEVGVKYTIEFYPEEGMYHYDGHRTCQISFTPMQTRKHKGICPVCRKPLTIGVMSRVDELADRALGEKGENAAPFRKLVELDKIIAEAMNIKSRHSAKVQTVYLNLIKQGGNELNILLNIGLKDLEKMTDAAVVEGIKRVREGKLIIKPGFDGQYGEVKIFSDQEKKKNKQKSLFE
jgi:PHP family Zn ribbon phosphoesterase